MSSLVCGFAISCAIFIVLVEMPKMAFKFYTGISVYIHFSMMNILAKLRCLLITNKGWSFGFCLGFCLAAAIHFCGLDSTKVAAVTLSWQGFT